ncbi:hypothetical protein [Zobellia sp. 1_MG-2023]|uniref:hypothetical protein n=1 Tax=Zobellia sp. 1_MG-2023 TaxID=3062626 RepID=UPI0026E2D242|nr:hypothetical protein [Zobellia sp. 1_MG-2023]MDO6819079.1 hypothetical protein [Zobellia sp. 1_MG-2023]
MSVPNNYSFSLQDVQTELNLGSTASLQDCFNAARSGGFNSTYQGSKDRLRNFRAYDRNKSYGTQIQSVGYGGSSSNACGSTRFNFYTEYGKSWVNTNSIWTNYQGTIKAPAQWYSDGYASRYWNGSSFTSLGSCS